MRTHTMEDIGQEKANLCLLITLLYLFRGVITPEIYLAMFTGFLRSWRDCLYYLVNLVAFIPGIVLFFTGKRTGWFLLAVYTGYQAVHPALFLGNYVWNWENANPLNPFQALMMLAPALLYGYAVYKLSTKRIREPFGISTRMLWLTLTIIIIGGVFLIR